MTPEELKKMRGVLMSLINEVIIPCQSIDPSNDEEATLFTAMSIIARHVPKLLDYINELESMPLIQTIREQQKEIERLRGALEHIREYWNRDNNTQAMADACWSVIEIADRALEGESHATL